MSKRPMPTASPIDRLIWALVQVMVEEYLTSDAVPGNDPQAGCTNPVLPSLSDAA